MNNIVTREKMSSFLQKDSTKKYLDSVLADKKDSFVTNLASLVSQDKKLAECTNVSVMSGAIVATSLGLSLNKSFGYAYLIPFKETKYNRETREREHIKTEAQFQIGYKGFIQLAMRTGAYKRLNAIAIYENQFISWNAMDEELELNQSDGEGRVVGYVGFFELLNGFKKTVFWTHDKMMSHANKYSQAFDADKYKLLQEGKIPQKEMWKYSSFWYKSFDEMALKTIYKTLLSKFGTLSEEMQKAIIYDQSVVENDNHKYIDNIQEAEIEEQPDPLEEVTKQGLGKYED